MSIMRGTAFSIAGAFRAGQAALLPRRGGLALAVGLTLLAAGCRSGGSTLQDTPQQDGLYDFVARTGRLDLRGTLTWMSGEASFEMESGFCRSDEMNTDLQTFRYLCEGGGTELRNLVYIIDRHRPVTRSRWRANLLQTRQRQVCVRYEVRNNQQVCVQYRTETYEVSLPVGGPLTFTRRQG